MTLCLRSHVEMHKLSVGNFVKTNGVWDPASQYCDENGKMLEEVLLLTLKSTKGYLNLFRWRVLRCIASARSASAALFLPLVAPDFV